MKGFYAGGISQVLFVAPEKAIKFTTNDYMLTITDNKIIEGMCAGLSQVIVTNPMEILKIQSQMNMKYCSFHMYSYGCYKNKSPIQIKYFLDRNI